MTTASATMNSMFDGKPTGGFLGLPLTTLAETREADIIIPGVSSATP